DWVSRNFAGRAIAAPHLKFSAGDRHQVRFDRNFAWISRRLTWTSRRWPHPFQNEVATDSTANEQDQNDHQNDRQGRFLFRRQWDIDARKRMSRGTGKPVATRNYTSALHLGRFGIDRCVSFSSSTFVWAATISSSCLRSFSRAASSSCCFFWASAFRFCSSSSASFLRAAASRASSRWANSVFCSSSSNEAALIVPALGSNAVVVPVGGAVSCPGAGPTIVLEGSIAALSPVRFSLALASDIASRSSLANSSAEGVRWLASFSSACRTTASICGGTSTPFEPSDGTSEVRCFFMIDGIELPLNGTSPQSI